MEQSRQSSLAELRNECERTKAAADRDAEESHRRIRAARFAHRRSSPDGSGEIVYRSTRDEVAEIWSVVCGFANEEFHRARLAGQHESSEAYAADGLLSMARAAARATAASAGRVAADGDKRTIGGESGSGSGSDGAPPPPSAPEASGSMPGTARRTTGSGAETDFSSAEAGASDGGSAVGGAAGDDSTPRSPRSGTGGTLPGPGLQAREAGDSLLPEEAGPPKTLPPPGRARSAVPTKIVVRIDLPALLRGWVEGGETCDIAGMGPVAVSAVRAMIDTGDPFLAAVVTRGVDVVSVAHLGRRPNAHQRTALDWLAPTCRVTGCDAAARLEYDHRHDWADTHVTLLAWLDRLCDGHHDKKTYDGWALVAGTGKRPMVPPDDPRHPRHLRDEPEDGG